MKIGTDFHIDRVLVGAGLVLALVVAHLVAGGVVRVEHLCRIWRN